MGFLLFGPTSLFHYIYRINLILMEIGVSVEQIQELWTNDLCDRSDHYFMIMIRMSQPIWAKVGMETNNSADNSVDNILNRLNKSQLNVLYKDLIKLKKQIEKLEQCK